MKKVRIIIFAKAPLAGLSKTRLIPALGLDTTERLAKQLFEHSLKQARIADVGKVELCVTPELVHPIWQTLGIPETIILSEQVKGDLGMKMSKSASMALEKGESVLLIGTDCPQLNYDSLRQAALFLQTHDACMIPVSDGGYCLLGLNKYDESVFKDIAWSTSTVAEITKQRLGMLGWSVREMGLMHDIDEPSDLKWLPKSWQLTD